MVSKKGSETVICKSEDLRLSISISAEGVAAALVTVRMGREGSSLVEGFGKAGGKVGLGSDVASLETELRDRDRASKGGIVEIRDEGVSTALPSNFCEDTVSAWEAGMDT